MLVIGQGPFLLTICKLGSCAISDDVIYHETTFISVGFSFHPLDMEQ